MEFQNLFWGLNKSSRSCNRKPPFVNTKNLKIKKRSENIFLLILDGPAQNEHLYVLSRQILQVHNGRVWWNR